MFIKENCSPPDVDGKSRNILATATFLTGILFAKTDARRD